MPNDWVLTYNLVFSGLVFLVLLFFLVWLKKQEKDKWRIIEQRDSHLEALAKTIEDLRNVLLNKRASFRLSVTEGDCAFEILEVGDKNLEVLLNKKGTGKIRDLSATGMGFSCSVDLPIRKKIVLQLDFNIRQEQFSLKGLLVRKSEHIDDNEITYGIEFMQLSTRDSARLMAILNKIKIRRKKITA